MCTFPAERRSVTAARRFASVVLGESPGEVREAVELMVSELATNCIRHVDSGFEVIVHRSDDIIRVEVNDHGAGIPVMRSPGPEDANGRGLWIVDMLSDAWGVTPSPPSGKTVWFTLSTTRDAGPGSLSATDAIGGASSGGPPATAGGQHADNPSLGSGPAGVACAPMTVSCQPKVEDLFRRLRSDGDQRARAELVERFLPLARRLALRYMGAREPLDDLVQVASLGLVKAIDRYDPERGVAFASYAVPTILGELKRYFRDTGWAAHVPRGAQERALKVEGAQRRLTAKTGRPPTFTELAQYTELSVEDVLDALEAAASHHAVSLDTPREDDEGDAGSLGDAFGTIDPGFALVDAGASIGAAACELTEREREVLALRFVADWSQAQIAAQIGVSQMQVSRILRRSLDRMAQLMLAVP
jgi:RNA polymerase sigma-B factor